MKIYDGIKYIVDISKGFIWDIFWDCITDAKLTKSRVLVNAIHIAIFHGLGCPDLFGILCLDLASAFRHLRDFSTWIGYPNSLPDWVSWILDLLWYLDFSFFSNCLRDFVCLDFFAANYLRMFASGLGVLTPAREHSSRGSFWPLVVTCSLQGEPELDKLVESWGL